MTLPETIAIHPDPAGIIVPRGHGQVLINPPLPVLEEVVRHAPAGSPWQSPHDTLRPALGAAWVEAAQRARKELAQALAQHAAATGQPAVPADIVEKRWVITGHQVEFYHAGVWAKVIVADAAARVRPDAVALDLLVDHDVVDELGMEVPAQRDGRWYKDSITWGHNAALPAEALSQPDEATFSTWQTALQQHEAAHSDALAIVLDTLRQSEPRRTSATGDPPRGYTPWMSAARRTLEKALDLQVLHVPTSLMCQGSAWLLFVQGWLHHAGAWAQAYNAQLAAYRTRMGIHNPAQPMPDLVVTDSRVELPFWIYRLGEARSRLTAVPRDGHVEIEHEGATVRVPAENGWAGAQALAAALRAAGLEIRPRALTLTMFARLFLADLFIHGIGGALYDQITDGLLKALFDTSAPYAVVSAAWLLPLAAAEMPENLSQLKDRRHHLAHNPQLILSGKNAATAALLDERTHLIQKITASLAAHRRTERLERRGWYRRLHDVNGELHASHPAGLAELDRRMAAAREQAADNKVLLWREYFFGLHSLESLRRFIQTVVGAGTLSAER